MKLPAACPAYMTASSIDMTLCWARDEDDRWSRCQAPVDPNDDLGLCAPHIERFRDG